MKGMVRFSSPRGQKQGTQEEERLVEKADVWFGCYYVFSLLGHLWKNVKQAWYLKILRYDSSSRARLGPDRLTYLYRYVCIFMVICVEKWPKPRGKMC